METGVVETAAAQHAHVCPVEVFLIEEVVGWQVPFTMIARVACPREVLEDRVVTLGVLTSLLPVGRGRSGIPVVVDAAGTRMTRARSAIEGAMARRTTDGAAGPGRVVVEYVLQDVPLRLAYWGESWRDLGSIRKVGVGVGVTVATEVASRQICWGVV